jgi:hypothetical protein
VQRRWRPARLLLPVVITTVAVALLTSAPDASAYGVPARPVLAALLVLLLLYATAQMMGMAYGRSRVAALAEMLIWVLLFALVVVMIWLGVWAVHTRRGTDSPRESRRPGVCERSPSCHVSSPADVLMLLRTGKALLHQQALRR